MYLANDPRARGTCLVGKGLGSYLSASWSLETTLVGWCSYKHSRRGLTAKGAGRDGGSSAPLTPWPCQTFSCRLGSAPYTQPVPRVARNSNSVPVPRLLCHAPPPRAHGWDPTPVPRGLDKGHPRGPSLPPAPLNRCCYHYGSLQLPSWAWTRLLGCMARNSENEGPSAATSAASWGDFLS